MVKQRPYHKRVRRLKWFIGICALIFLVLVYGYYQSTGTKEMMVTQDLSVPPNHYNYLGYGNFLNPSKDTVPLIFVEELTLDAFIFLYDFQLTKTNGIYYYAGDGSKLLAGQNCGAGDIIRFTFCDNNNDKTSCKTDIFANYWLVEKNFLGFSNDYPNFGEYYTANQGAFYYTYSCYYSQKYDVPIDYVDKYEKKYLYDNKCLSEADSFDASSKGINYNTEADCLVALEKLNKEQPKTCDYRTYNEYTCKTNNLYQKVQNTDCSIGFTNWQKTCDYGCDGGACLPKPPQTCNYLVFNEFQCIGDVKYQRVQKNTCEIGYFLPVGACDIANRIEECTYKPLNEFACIDNTVVEKVQMTTCDTKFNKFIERCNYGCQDGACLPKDPSPILPPITPDPKPPQDNTTITPDPVPPKDDSDSSKTLTCKGYEKEKDGACEFTFTKLGTTQGISDYAIDKPVNTILSTIVLIGVGALILFA